VSQEAWNQAPEQAQGKVATLAEQAREQVETLTESFDTRSKQRRRTAPRCRR
jgi:hypothetical protein